MYPDIQLELSVDAGFVDIVSNRFDAGVRLGETIARDMVAVRVGPDLRMAAVASPAYLATRPSPREPQDLARHNCINLRFPTYGGLYAWEFEQAGRAVNVRVEGQFTVNDTALALQAALDGVGIAYLPEAACCGSSRLAACSACSMHGAVVCRLPSVLSKPSPAFAGVRLAGRGANPQASLRSCLWVRCSRWFVALWPPFARTNSPVGSRS